MKFSPFFTAAAAFFYFACGRAAFDRSGRELKGPPGGRPNIAMHHRAVIRLEMDLVAKQRLDRLVELRGMTQIAVLSRLVKWLARQDEVVQASVLGLLSEEEPAILADVLLRRLAARRSAAAEPGEQ